jgi:cytochrome c
VAVRVDTPAGEPDAFVDHFGAFDHRRLGGNRDAGTRELETANHPQCVRRGGEQEVGDFKRHPQIGGECEAGGGFGDDGIQQVERGRGRGDVALQEPAGAAPGQPTGKAGLPILVSKAEAEKIIPRNELNLTGTFADGPFGFSVLKIKDGSLTVTGTNKAFGAAEPRGADLFKDASSLAGRYVSLTNVTFASPKFDGSGKIKVKGEAGEVSLLLPTTLKDRDVPPGGVNVFGVPVKVDGEWRLMASRFLSVSNKTNLALATKHTCISCHNPDIKAVGPSYRDVAAKYKDDPAARATLIAQIEKGGTGKWGVVPMPPLGAKVPPADREVLIDWVLGYRWDAILAE